MGMWTIPKAGDTGRFTPEQLDAFVQAFARGVVRRRMAVPAVLFLEFCKPLSFVGASLVQFFAPVFDMLVDPDSVEKLHTILADRERVESLLTTIETMAKEDESKTQADTGPVAPTGAADPGAAAGGAGSPTPTSADQGR